jgi:hypothetical protein
MTNRLARMAWFVASAAGCRSVTWPSRSEPVNRNRWEFDIALFIACSDSRINPHLLTQTEPGELFILRHAGNIVPCYASATGGEAATIQFTITAPGMRDVNGG